MHIWFYSDEAKMKPEMKQEYGSPQPQMMSSEGYEPLPFHTPQRPTDTPNSVAGTYDQPIQ